MNNEPDFQAHRTNAVQAYRKANVDVAMSTMGLVARIVRDTWPEVATLTAEWSDQGSFLSYVNAYDGAGESLDDDDVYADEDSDFWEFDERNAECWQAACVTVPGQRGDTFTLSVDKMLELATAHFRELATA